ncbi:MAG: hypothetical protein LBT96_04030 [Campylobacteraceae bacterium]|nr:hypothetical protein [Campylobacteraceae bacterium]
MKNIKTFNTRAFVSVVMFLSVITLAGTGVIIQIIEALGDSYESVENIPLFIFSILHCATAVHVLTGFSFAIISAVHIAVNYRALKNYFCQKKEAVFAILLFVIIVFVGAVLSFIFF